MRKPIIILAVLVSGFLSPPSGAQTSAQTIDLTDAAVGQIVLSGSSHAEGCTFPQAAWALHVEPGGDGMGVELAITEDCELVLAKRLTYPSSTSLLQQPGLVSTSSCAGYKTTHANLWTVWSDGSKAEEVESWVNFGHGCGDQTQNVGYAGYCYTWGGGEVTYVHMSACDFGGGYATGGDSLGWVVGRYTWGGGGDGRWFDLEAYAFGEPDGGYHCRFSAPGTLHSYHRGLGSACTPPESPPAPKGNAGNRGGGAGKVQKS